MFSKIAYGLSIGGTAATLVMRLIGADDTLTFLVSAITILGLAYTAVKWLLIVAVVVFLLGVLRAWVSERRSEKDR